MTTSIGAPQAEGSRALFDRGIDAVRRIAQIPHDARAIRDLATDAIDDSQHAARRVIKTAQRRLRDVSDLGDDLAHRVRRRPMQAIAIALGAGLMAGATLGAVCAWRVRAARRSPRTP